MFPGMKYLYRFKIFTMKRILYGIVALMLSTPVFAQSLEDIEAMVTKKDLTSARISIDAYLAEPKNSGKSEGWYYKGYIYNALSYEPSTPALDKMNLKTAAFEA